MHLHCTFAAAPTCPDPGNVDFATRSPRQGPFQCGSTIRYICQSGYRLTQGQSLITCQENGQWDPPKSMVCQPDGKSVL